MELLKQHPIGQIIPPMSAEERSSLRNDLVVNGLRVPIMPYEGQILDGWHRYELCIEENIEPRFYDYEGEDPFGLVRSLNLSRRHLTLAQKKEVAKHIFEREPGRSDRSVGEELGLSHHTVARAREEAESNWQNANKEEVGAESNYNVQNAHKDPERGGGCDGGEIPASERVEASGRKARGRKPLSPEEKAARVKARAAAKAEAKKETKLKPLTSARDDMIGTLSELISANLDRLQDLVQIISAYDGVIHQKFTLGQRTRWCGSSPRHWGSASNRRP
jgi:hypothetical protein